MRSSQAEGWFDEVAADRCIHWIGIAAGAAGVSALLGAARHRDIMIVFSVAIYGAGLLAMLVCSASYHLARDLRRKALLRRFDHAAIFFLIAGTYTPFTLTGIGGAWSL